MSNSKIIPFNELHRLKDEQIDNQGVLIGGCFDILHYGHLLFFQKAADLGKHLIIALESDEFIIKRKKRQPFHTQMHRAEMLAALTIVDAVILLPFLQTDKEYFDLVKQVKPAVIAVTAGDAYIKQKQEQASQIGATVKEVTELLKPFSTSQILDYATILRD